MVDKRPALGRGLSALIPETPAPASADRALEIDTDLLRPNKFQPRTHVDEERIDELARSIKSNGIIQPIVVRRVDRGERAAHSVRAAALEGQHPLDDEPAYEIVAGERRWRAAQRAGLLKVPVVVRDIPEDRLLAVALIENIQREDLNPIEEAVAYRRLADEFHLTQEQIADAVGKDRSSIANYVRLLRLPQEVRANVASNALSMGHARALLALADEAAQLRLARDIVSRQLSVRETEALVKKAASPAAPQPLAADVHTRAAEDKLRLALGTRVRINRRGKGGRIEIDFLDEDELQRLYERLIAE
jgi:ParB family chromosome partitioning protein